LVITLRPFHRPRGRGRASFVGVDDILGDGVDIGEGKNPSTLPKPCIYPLLCGRQVYIYSAIILDHSLDSGHHWMAVTNHSPTVWTVLADPFPFALNPTNLHMDLILAQSNASSSLPGLPSSNLNITVLGLVLPPSGTIETTEYRGSRSIQRLDWPITPICAWCPDKVSDEPPG